MGARWRRRSTTTLTIAYGRNVPRCCTISFFAVFVRALTYSLGRCWATRLRTWNVWPCGFSQVQGPCGRNRVVLLSCTSLAMRTAGETCCRDGFRGRGSSLRESHGGAFRRERQLSDEGCCARRERGRCAGRTHPRYGVGAGFAGFLQHPDPT